MQLLVFEDAGFVDLLPLVYSRATFNLRCGFDNLLAKIESAFGRTAEALFVRPDLAAVMAERQPRRVNQPGTADDQLWVNGRLLVRRRFELPPNSAAWQEDSLLAARIDRARSSKLSTESLLNPAGLREVVAGCSAVEVPDGAATLIAHPWQLVTENPAEIVRQFKKAGLGEGARVDSAAILLNPQAVSIGAGARVKSGAVLDAEDGPIHVGKEVIIHPGAVIRGPCYIGDGCVVQPGASIHGGCSVGDVCKIGGELDGVIVHGYSNKQHDGFLGHSYVGEWVNLGADTVGSDLKNTYGPVRVPINGRPIDTGEPFIGAFIGDHTKTAIGTRLPTGCVIGYACNVAVGGWAPRFVPSFTWLTDAGAEPMDARRALAVAHTVVARRKRSYSKHEDALFLSIANACRRRETATAT